jgi:drug/metabolite transporter (DMT)-like permease
MECVNIASISSRSWLGLAFLVAFVSLTWFSAYAWLLRVAPVTLVATYAYVNPLVAILLGSILAQEVLNARILVAALVIIESVLLINFSRKSKAEVFTAVIE